MSISHDGTDLLAIDTHDDILPREAFELPVKREQFFGVNGESHVIGESLGRLLDCRALVWGYATRALLNTAIAEVEALQGQLTGTITMQIGGSTVQTIENCTFVAIQKLEPGVILDASGVHGYMCHLLLTWIQRKG